MRLKVELNAEPLQEKIARHIAWLLPPRVAMWAFIRVAAHATQGPYGTDHIDDLRYSDFMARWENRYDYLDYDDPLDEPDEDNPWEAIEP
jgi:hypothetical protein